VTIDDGGQPISPAEQDDGNDQTKKASSLLQQKD